MFLRCKKLTQKRKHLSNITANYKKKKYFNCPAKFALKKIDYIKCTATQVPNNIQRA
jgi:hypothetical protein